MTESEKFNPYSTSKEAERLLAALSATEEAESPQHTQIHNHQAREANSKVSGQTNSEESSPSPLGHDTEEATLFIIAVMQLKTMGILNAASPAPSFRHSRTSSYSYVVCDSKEKVIGRVPLHALKDYAARQKNSPIGKYINLESSNSTQKDEQSASVAQMRHSLKSTAGTQVFFNPETNHTVRVSVFQVVLGSLLFGFLFFLIIGEPVHGVINFVGSFLLSSIFLGWVVWLGYAFAAPNIVRAKWLSRGYIESQR